MKPTVEVKLKGQGTSYNIIFERITKDFLLGENKEAYYIVDANVHNLFLKVYKIKSFIFYSCEENKNLESATKILDFLIENDCKRKDLLIAIGGGIVGDVAGFAASIYMRGIPFVQVPTTLLSMVDSSVGGKNGVNYKNIKNYIGTYYQPKQVFIDVDFIKTLPEEEYLNGLAEVIKTAFLFDDVLVEKLEKNYKAILAKAPESLEDIIISTIKHKIAVVEADEKEASIRRLLNFGHTIGHAIEVDSHFEIKHGFAVAKGMYLETLYGEKSGLIEKGTLKRLRKLLTLYNFDINYNIRDDKIFENALVKDKKNIKNSTVLALPVEVGKSCVFENININNMLSGLLDDR
jgi:3-dehydroquinate synthase